MLLAGDESLREWLYRHLSEEAILQIEEIRREIQSRLLTPSVISSTGTGP